MAEFVQYRSEQTISELEQMQRIELFSKEEIRLIAAKRKRYEYKMQRIVKSKDTFLRYIQYELDLIRLIKLRREKTKINFKQAEIEQVIKSRVGNLFFQATGKHNSDIKLWMSHIKFCMQWNMKSTISGILTRMLAIHNDKVKVWKFAANWEFENNASIETARKLLLRGLRFHPKSKSLFKAYLRMELQCAENKRKTLIEKEKLEIDLILAEIEMSEQRLKGADEKTREIIKISMNEKREIIASKTEHKLETKLVEIIIDSALMRFRQVETFIELHGVIKPFKGSSQLQWKYLQMLHEKFPGNELVYDLEAMMHLEPNSSAQACKVAYTDALTSTPTEKMWCLYLETLCSASQSSLKKVLRDELEECHNLGLLNEKFYPKMITLFDRRDQRALTLLQKGLEKFPKNSELHHLHVKIHLSKGKEDDALSAFEKAEGNLGNNNLDMLVLYKTIIQHYETRNLALADKFFKRGVYAGPNVASELKSCYLQWVCDKKGIEAAYEEYHIMKLVPPLCLKLHYKMIHLEMIQPEVNVHNVRLCYDMASHQFGEKDPELWMKFIMFEMGKGDPKLAPLVYSRAKARLSADLLDKFVTQYTVNRSNGKV